MNPTRLLIRADANVAIGTGHAMRCLALAQAWQDAGGQAVFAMAEATPAVEQRLRNENCEVRTLQAAAASAEDVAQTVAIARQLGAEWVVIDGYQFGADYQSSLKQAGLRVLFVDDNGHAAAYSAEIVLNQNVHAEDSFYARRNPYTQLLLGCRYAMLRREFRPWRPWERIISKVATNLLVTLGGSDPENVTRQILDVVTSEDGWTTTAVVGGSNPHARDLQAWIETRKPPVTLVVDAINMPELMADADLAIAAAGSTSWEMCFLGLPALLLVAAENQRRVAEELARRRAAVNLGRTTDWKPAALKEHLQTLRLLADTRQAMSSAGRSLVDGRGAERVVLSMQPAIVRLREAKTSDCRLLWEWASDRTVRERSFSPEPIGWEDHCAWFDKKLHDRATRIYIALGISDTPVGQIRLDETRPAEAEIDVSLDRRFRGLGLAAHLIALAVQSDFAQNRLRLLHAYVLAQNVSSSHAFERAGFHLNGTQEREGKPVLHYTLQKL